MPIIVSGLTPEEAEYVRYHSRKVRPLSHAEMSRKSTAVRHAPFAGWRVVHDPLAISMVPVPGWVAPEYVDLVPDGPKVIPWTRVTPAESRTMHRPRPRARKSLGCWCLNHGQRNDASPASRVWLYVNELDSAALAA